ncbi:MAG: grxC [Hydrocarboniphaga sp.]|uniref:glutaredoxin 3 n=1 Tax=Hydrocarboniphaga sp. TaxID=2033016 RepID=UPI00262070EF|nr:glutaredoxin 3 [Hydrocarboniphaga sp.]MDB5972054.1 grxC [Hydrocarboniphaga sp.]
MNPVRVYSTAYCPFCVMAKRLLENKGVAFEEIRVDQDLQRRNEMMQLSGRRTVPQIFVGQTHVGGFDDLSALDRAGGLDPLLADV